MQEVINKITAMWSDTPLEPLQLYNEVMFELDDKGLNADTPNVLYVINEVLKIVYINE